MTGTNLSTSTAQMVPPLERWTPSGSRVRIFLAVVLAAGGLACWWGRDGYQEGTALLIVAAILSLISAPVMRVLGVSNRTQELFLLIAMAFAISVIGLVVPAFAPSTLPWLLVLMFAATFKLSVTRTVTYCVFIGGLILTRTYLPQLDTRFAMLNWAPHQLHLLTGMNFAGAAVIASWLGIVKVRRAKLQEVRLARSETSFRKIINQVAAGMFVTRDDVLIDVNKVGLALIGANHSDEIIGLKLGELFEQSIDRPLSSSDALVGLTSREMKVRTLDEVARTVELSRMQISWTGGPATLITAFDLTERKWAERERERLQAQIRHGQKLETLGLLAGGVAHDFNNILQAILANTDLVSTQMTIPDPARLRLEKVASAATRGADLVEKMLAYAGRGQNVTTSVNLSSLANEVIDLASAAFPKKIKIHRELQADLPSIRGDEGQLQQIIMNLLTNAADAMSECGGDLHIRSGVMRADAELLMRAYLGETRPTGLYVFLEVADAGQGIAPDQLSRIFDPFFTTKERGRGLGLASTMGILNGHAGAMIVQSEEGQGARFRALFPPEDVPQVRAHASTSGPTVYRGAGTILVVDDEPTILEATAAALRTAGFSVICASHGGEALAIFSEDPRMFSAVVLDMAMPVMDGAQTLERMRDLAPDVFAVLSTGYAHEYEDENLDALGFDEVLRKPYPVKSLIQLLSSRDIP